MKRNRPAKNLRGVPDLDRRNGEGHDPSTKNHHPGGQGQNLSTKNPRPEGQGLDPSTKNRHLGGQGQNLSTEIQDVRVQGLSTRSLLGNVDVRVREVVQDVVVAKVYRLITAVIVGHRVKLILTKVLETERDVVNGRYSSSIVLNLTVSREIHFLSINLGAQLVTYLQFIGKLRLFVG